MVRALCCRFHLCSLYFVLYNTHYIQYKLLDDLKDRRGYYQLKEETLDRTMWRNRFGRGFGPVV